MTSCETRTSEQGNTFSSALLRSFIETALQHDAVNDAVTEMLYDQVVCGRYHPSVIVESLRPLIDDVLNTATAHDWQRIADDLIADARQTVAAGTEGCHEVDQGCD
jgi:hypothetical protein